MFTIPVTGSVGDDGLLVHEDDPAAQLALSLYRIEEAMGRAGHVMSDLATLRVLTTDRPALEQVVDVLTERLEAVGSSPAISIHTVDHLPLEGMTVALEATVSSQPPAAVQSPGPRSSSSGDRPGPGLTEELLTQKEAR